ncbi:exodeoxyribonuclease V subunit alpha [Alishewanella sp. 16-MA]|uniref:RecBCD enzyme subunit RecD n=1 Tax=Alishewanella maricola TaxID=2795740 RepID=A0ABS8C6R0_9ALTE|nr:exodeoxyribonuclease V subunit alpha [Alishewanella maricola]MCB5228029.1 exodeoxyribonuclease V subunit alpha [Alishewanella maricola]
MLNNLVSNAAESALLKQINSPQLLQLLVDWQRVGWLTALDLAFARFIQQHTAVASQAECDTANRTVTNLSNNISMLLAALLSHQVGRGHVCLSLRALLAEPERLLNISVESALSAPTSASFTPLSAVSSVLLAPSLGNEQEASLVTPTALLAGLTLSDLQQALAHSAAVQVSSEQQEAHPLVLVGETLYLYRYWQYERQLAADLQRLMQPVAKALPPVAQLNSWLSELFDTPQTTAAINWQKLACVNTLRSHFSVITGGPGTGKTYTVVRLLALLQRLHLADSADAQVRPLVIKLAAPTGKAAARLKESIQAATEQLRQLPASWHSALQQISADSSTLHKLLGVQAGTRQFRHHRAKPLALDVLIIDEASMVDIELMHATLAALLPGAKLVLLGDKDQLASVEAGAILGQLCAGAEQGGYSRETLAFLQGFTQSHLPEFMHVAEAPRHLQHVIMLRVSRRFDDSSGIGALARVVNDGRSNEVAALFKPDSGFTDLHLLQPTQPDPEGQQALLASLQQLCQQGFAGYLQQISARPAPGASAEQFERWARSVLKAYQGFQLLTPVRDGPFGVSGLNALVQQSLSFVSRSASAQGRQDSWYEGRPVMITANDYNLNLRNGDIGIVLRSADTEQKRVVFVDSDNQLRWILPSRLAEVTTVFAMTVHKSQGSEFTHTVLVLPDRDNPVLSRELLYTGLTRAAQQLTIVVPSWPVLTQAVDRPTIRAGQLHLSFSP